MFILLKMDKYILETAFLIILDKEKVVKKSDLAHSSCILKLFKSISTIFNI